MWIVRIALDRPYTFIVLAPHPDYGRSVEVASGLGPTDAVILDPADSLVSGTAVRVSKPPSEPRKP